MRIIKSYKKVKLTIKKSLLNKLIESGQSYYPNEFGGFLLGYYSEDFKSLHICDFLIPKKYKSSPTTFERSNEGIIKEFTHVFKEKGLYYVGEWHTHPDGTAIFSATDLETMIEIAKCEAVKIENPILLIISIDQEKLFNYNFYFYKDKNLYAYE